MEHFADIDDSFFDDIEKMFDENNNKHNTDFREKLKKHTDDNKTIIKITKVNQLFGLAGKSRLSNELKELADRMFSIMEDNLSQELITDETGLRNKMNSVIKVYMQNVHDLVGKKAIVSREILNESAIFDAVFYGTNSTLNNHLKEYKSITKVKNMLANREKSRFSLSELKGNDKFKPVINMVTDEMKISLKEICAKHEFDILVTGDMYSELSDKDISEVIAELDNHYKNDVIPDFIKLTAQNIGITADEASRIINDYYGTSNKFVSNCNVKYLPLKELKYVKFAMANQFIAMKEDIMEDKPDFSDEDAEAIVNESLDSKTVEFETKENAFVTKFNGKIGHISFK